MNPFLTALMAQLKTPANWATAGRVGAGAVGGAGINYGLLRDVGGYKDDPSASLFGTLLGAAGGGMFGYRPSMGKAYTALGAEFIPAGLHAVNKVTNRPAEYDLAKTDLIKNLTSPTMKGIAGGALAAGGAGLLSGTIRRKSQKEETGKDTRESMVSHDMLRWLLPMMLAGGVTGYALGGGKTPAAGKPAV